MINIKADCCAICGAEAETGYNGDDFAFNVKRARCSDPECKNHFTLRFAGEVMLTESIPTIIEWNSAQLDIADGMSPVDAWELARPQ